MNEKKKFPLNFFSVVESAFREKKICVIYKLNLNIFSGKIFPSGIAADSYKKAVDLAIQKLRDLESNSVEDVANGAELPP